MSAGKCLIGIIGTFIHNILKFMPSGVRSDQRLNETDTEALSCYNKYDAKIPKIKHLIIFYLHDV